MNVVSQLKLFQFEIGTFIFHLKYFVLFLGTIACAFSSFSSLSLFASLEPVSALLFTRNCSLGRYIITFASDRHSFAVKEAHNTQANVLLRSHQISVSSIPPF